MQKSISVVLSLAGVALVSFSTQSGHDQQNTVFGIITCIVSTLLFAVFEVSSNWLSIHKYNPQHAVRDSVFMQGMTGLWTFGTGWLLIVAFDVLSIEHFTMPGWSGMGMIFLLALMDTTYFVAFLIGVALTNVVVMASGALLIVPVSFVIDCLIRRKYEPTFEALVGTTLICVGFIMMELPIFAWLTRRGLLPVWCVPTKVRKHSTKQHRQGQGQGQGQGHGQGHGHH